MGLNWVRLAQGTVEWRSVVNKLMNIRVARK